MAKVIGLVPRLRQRCISGIARERENDEAVVFEKFGQFLLDVQGHVCQRRSHTSLVTTKAHHNVKTSMTGIEVDGPAILLSSIWLNSM